MKIIYIHQYFKTPEEGGAIRSYYLAKGLVKNHFEVELITAHNHPNYTIKNIEGINVHYLPVPYDNEMRFGRRVMSFLMFFVRATILGKKIKGVDFCYATSTPLTVGCISLFLKKYKKVPYVFEVRDLWPEAPIQMGIIKNKFVKKILQWLEVKIYKEAKAIVALSPGIEEHIQKLVPHTPIHIIPNMSDLQLFKKSININETNDEKKPFVISYFGAIGKVNNVYSMVQMAIEAKKKSENIKFNIIGEGASFSNIKELINIHQLDNVAIHDFKNKVALQEILKSTDASFISYLKLQVLETSSPNKFFDSLASGKLIILNIQGWLYDLIKQHYCGIYIDTNSYEDFKAKISPFLEDRNLLNTYKLNSLNLAKEKFSKEDQIKKLVNLLNNLNLH